MDKSVLAVNTYEKIAQVYTKEYYDDLSDATYIDKFLSLLPVGGKVLDVGCGPGQFSQYIKEKGFSVSGIDFSGEMLEIAKQKTPDISFEKMDMRALKYSDMSFDGLLVAYSLIHIASIQIPNTLNGFYRVLKPKGIIEIIAQKGKANQIVDQPFLPSEKMFFNFFTKDRLSKFLTKAGFSIIYQDEAPTPDPNSMAKKIIYTIARRED